MSEEDDMYLDIDKLRRAKAFVWHQNNEFKYSTSFNEIIAVFGDKPHIDGTVFTWFASYRRELTEWEINNMRTQFEEGKSIGWKVPS